MKDQMILEALNYAATFMVTPGPFRPFIGYSIRLWSRASRCRKHWAEHEKNSRSSILDAARSIKQRRTAVVLGSGLLRDVPVIELSRLFDTVVLVDLVHPASVRGWLLLRRLKNVRLISRDLSGYDDLEARKKPEPFAFMRQVPYLDFVASANLLSQIGTGMETRLSAAPAGTMPEDALQQLLMAHIEGLASLPCKTCLVTDIAYKVIDRTGHVHEQVDLLHGVTPPPGDRQWDWPVVPFGEENRDYQVVHTVTAR